MINVINYDTRNFHPVRAPIICIIAMLLIATSHGASAGEPVLELAFTSSGRNWHDWICYGIQTYAPSAFRPM